MEWEIILDIYVNKKIRKRREMDLKMNVLNQLGNLYFHIVYF